LLVATELVAMQAVDEEAGWGLNLDNLQVGSMINNVMGCLVTGSGWRVCLLVAADVETV
jgi:hypothetical protein